jgi:single-strand DNA-binding protein
MAEGVNKAILVGNLGKDPELSYTQNGTGRCRFPLATSESYSNSAGERQERTEWHNIVVWGKLAETVSKFMQKGRQCYVEGRIQTRSWDDKEGMKRYITEINASKVTFLGGRGDGGSQNSGGYQGGGSGGPPSDSGGGGGDSFSGGPGPNDDDIPF